ncbi:hypothetical protein NE865_13965 [Phthorimaea operculella]|nr:hypothetical protein NE865_13965 [Phthorimaea operculella]
MSEVDRTEEKKQLVALRGHEKGKITRQEKYFKDSAPNATLEDLEVRLKLVIETLDRHEDYHKRIKLLDPETPDDDIEERALILQAKIMRLIKNKTPKEKSAHGNNNGTEFSAKFPALDIPIFNGKNITDYKPFIDMYTAIIDNDNKMPAVQKLCLLKRFLRDEPLQLIDNLPIVGDSYPAALKLLKKRYDNNALLVTNHVSLLLDLPNVQRGTAVQLREFVAKHFIPSHADTSTSAAACVMPSTTP